MLEQIKQGWARFRMPASDADDGMVVVEIPPSPPVARLPHADRMAVLTARHIVKIHGTTAVDGGPVMVFFEPKGTYPGARNEEVYAAAALMVQGTRILASFQALSEEDYACEAVQTMVKHQHDLQPKLASLPLVTDGRALNAAFADFVAWCWKDAFEGFKPLLDPERVDVFGAEDMVRAGLVHMVHFGLLDGQEMHFFHRAAPGREHMEELFGLDYASQLHPLHIQRLSSIALGLGYSPFVTDGGANALGLPGDYANPGIGVRHLVEIFFAMKRHDPRIERYRLQGW